MTKNLFIILGNGFSIDFLSFLKSNDDSINIKNLFKKGDMVSWPNTKEPFLSFKHCPNLWDLGARSYITDDKANKLIEEIMTCANLLLMSDTIDPKDFQNKKYILAYNELVEYLRYLFFYYDNIIKDEELNEIEKWSWSNLFTKINIDETINNVTIVTYNYDIWLERVLKKLKVPFYIKGIERKKKNSKICILKPHGSINLLFKSLMNEPASEYQISYGEMLPIYPLKDFKIGKNLIEDLLIKSRVKTIIPPAGNSSRNKNKSWPKQFRDYAIKIVKNLSNKDLLIIAGISYWHVDRDEIDDILVHCNKDINVIINNPDPPKELLAVLTTLFKNVVLYNNSCNIDNAINYEV